MPFLVALTVLCFFDSICNLILMSLETALKLDTLVGDIEDAVSSTVNRNLRKHPSALNSEVSTLKTSSKKSCCSIN